MLLAIRNTLKKTKDPKRSAYIWNAINAMLSACQCPVILMVINRTNNVNDAGVFSIAFAVASLMLYIGLYGLRRFQASDVLEKYTFRQYHGMRFITCAVMIVVSLGYCIYGMIFRDYSLDKFMIIFIVCMLKVIQAYSDVVHGRMQQKDRLDIATKCSSVRYVMEVLTYCLVLVLTHDLLVASIICLAVSVIVLFLTTINAGKEYCQYKPELKKNEMKMLTIEAFPLFASLFLNMYISNAPKYAIDAYLTDQIQALYNFIFMPAFMVGLLANFIFNPILTSYAELWQSKIKRNVKRLIKLIKRQCVIVLGLTALGLLIAYTIGIPVLSIVFGVDLTEYKNELCIVMLGGGMLAYSTFFSTVVTIIRLQRPMFICYGACALAAYLLSGAFVKHGGIMGAVIMYGVIMSLLSVMLFFIMLYGIKKRYREAE